MTFFLAWKPLLNCSIFEKKTFCDSKCWAHFQASRVYSNLKKWKLMPQFSDLATSFLSSCLWPHQFLWHQGNSLAIPLIVFTQMTSQKVFSTLTAGFIPHIPYQVPSGSELRLMFLILALIKLLIQMKGDMSDITNGSSFVCPFR